MNKISKSKLAELAGCSPQYIDKVQKQYPPIVDFIEDGQTKKGKPRIKVDQDGPLTKQFIASQITKEPDPQKEKHKNKPKIKKPAVKKDPAENEEQEPTTHATALKYGTEEKHDLDKKKLRLTNEKLEIEIAIKRNSLIDKNLVVSTFNQLGNIDENQFKSLGVSTCPKYSAVYVESYTTKTEEILKLLGKEKDTELKNDISKIMNAGESTRVSKMIQITEDATGGILKNIKHEFDLFLLRAEDVKK